MPLAGILFISVLVLWLCYLVPYLASQRGQWATDRVLARFSPGLKVLEVPTMTAAQGNPILGQYLLPNGEQRAFYTMQGETLMQRKPVTAQELHQAVMADRIAKSAQARRALLARRKAAARRRLLLTSGLVLTLALTLGLAAWTTMSIWWSLIPAVATATVLVLGRRAVVAAQAADAKYRKWVTSPHAPTAVVTTTTVEAQVTRSQISDQRSHADQKADQAGADRDDSSEVAVAEIIEEESVVAQNTDVAGADSGENSHIEDAELIDEDNQNHEDSEDIQGTEDIFDAQANVATGQAQLATKAGESNPQRPVTGLQVHYEVDFTETWAPTPIPQPSYQLKATAPRVRPQELSSADIAASTTDQPTPATTAAPTTGVGTAQSQTSNIAQTGKTEQVPVEESADTEVKLNLDEILRRRRQAG